MQILFYNRYILFTSNLSFGHMGKLFIYLFFFFFHLLLLDLQGNVAIITSL